MALSNTAFPQLKNLLRQHFGFSTFRPYQEEIIADVLAGRDTCALLPTGGGKSLCFQLPALALPGTTIVVSPLIALMKDQVDALHACGIEATCINSSISAAEANTRLRGLRNNQYKLVYVAPERLMLPHFIELLKECSLSLIAIDEAHCISEWGHDFRPEYRQLAQLRTIFPKLPVLALTATATGRVREDIIRQLHLRESRTYIASFNRPNLHYRVESKKDAYGQTLAFIKRRSDESGIIYCQSRKSAESLAERLVEDGIPARAYHAGMEQKERGANQESFLRDDTRVICATIAFGMGINKPNVRFVIHYDLPKNIEGYYQETGRAGRDSLPSECLLLFSRGDMVKQLRFIEDKPAQEAAIARQQLEQMAHFAESSECRRKILLNYFGEELPVANCGSCDNCLNPKETYDATVAAQKILSCAYRVKEKSGFPVGVGHLADILVGSNSEKVRRFSHDTLSTFGIGREMSAQSWAEIGRELVRLGFLRQIPEKMNAVEITPEGMAALKSRQEIQLTRRPVAEKRSRVREQDEGSYDHQLFDHLRAVRKKLADEREVPAYVILSDVSLRQMAREYPVTSASLARISGFGQKKLADLGPLFLEEIGSWLDTHSRQSLPGSSPRKKSASGSPTSGIAASSVPSRTSPRSLGNSARETLKSLRDGKSIPEIASARQLVESTIYSHVAEAIAAGEKLDLSSFFTPEDFQAMKVAFDQFGFSNLTGVRESLQDRYSFEILRIARAALQSGRTP